MRINVKGVKRDQLRRERYKAIADEHVRVVAGEPLKQLYWYFGQGKHASLKANEYKHGERRRVNVALSKARYEHTTVIHDNPATAITRLQNTSNQYA
ncbi:MAG TPA: hypothetical protein VF281_03990 [Candidatus Saccharimonadales bacterium]